MDPFADAEAVLERARAHVQEYRTLASSEAIWSFNVDRSDEGAFVYSIVLNRHQLARLAPIAAEAANGFFHALDHIVGATARAADVKRGMGLSWPWKIIDDPDAGLAGAVKPALDEPFLNLRKKGMPDHWLSVIEKTFADQSMGLKHIDVLKEVALSGKHWQLVPTEAQAVAVAWITDGATDQTIVEFPQDHFDENDEYVFYKGEEISTNSGFQFLTSRDVAAPDREFRPEPLAAFGYLDRFVCRAIENARSCWESLSAE